MSENGMRAFKKSDDVQQRRMEMARLLEEGEFETQEALADVLKDMGYNASQATVSRDLDFLEITSDPKTGFYSLSLEAKEKLSRDRLSRTARDDIRDILQPVHYFAVRTRPGFSKSMAVLIEESDPRRVLGTIAGDDMVLVFTKDEKTSEQVANVLRQEKQKRGPV